MRKFPLILSTLALSVAGCDGSAVEESTSFTSREAAIKWIESAEGKNV